jgi:uncharacterized protein YebE (UPF0316 family)
VNELLEDATASPLVMPLVIFAAEVCVVTLCTMRTIFVSRGRKVPAAVLGFFEVSIWLFCIGKIMQNLSDLRYSAAFAGGFTLGNYLGVLLEGQLALGNVLLRVITRRDAAALIDDLKAANCGVTRLDAEGATGPVHVVLTVIRRKQLGRVVALVKRFDPNVFYSVDDLNTAAASPAGRGRVAGLIPSVFKLPRAA